MSNILKGILNEVDPNNYDSDWDYQDAVARSGKSRSSYRSQEDDTSDADIEYSKKMYKLSQKQKRDTDHDRLATGTNESEKINPIGAFPKGPKSSRPIRPPLKTSAEMAGMLNVDIFKFSRLAKIFPNFPKPVEGIRAKNGSKLYYNVPEFNKWVKDNDILTFLKQNVGESLDDPWGDQGNFAGDKPVNVGNVSMKNIQTGDTVKYFGQPSKVVAMSKDRKHSRITITKGMGNVTQDVLTSDLQQLGRGVNEEQLDEISNEKLGQYKTAAYADSAKADSEGDYDRGNKRFSGIIKATKKQFKNDIDQHFADIKKKSAISQGINELAPTKPPTAGAFGGNKDYGQPNSSRYIGKDKFVVGTTNNYVLTATIDKWGLEWDEDDEIWFLDSPGAAHIADASEGEIELPPPREQRNQIHDLVTDYLNEHNSQQLQQVAAYFGHTPDGEMATNESISKDRFNSKQEVINHFVKNGKSAAAGAAAWERGYRGSSNKPIELKKPPQRSYHDDLDDKRYASIDENLGDQLKSTSLDALVRAKLEIERQREADMDAWRQDFEKNTVQKAQQGLRREFEPTPVAQPGEKHSVLKARLSQLDSAIQKQELLDKLVDRLERKGILTPAMQNDADTTMHVRYGAKDNYESLNKKLDNAIRILQSRLDIRKISGLKEVHDERDEYDNPRQGRDYGKGNLFVDPGSNEFKKEVHLGANAGERGKPKNLKGISKKLPADAFGRTTGKIPAGKQGKVYNKMSNTDEVDEGWSQKYKSSINCSHPKGFSQKAHCAGKKKHNESIDNVMEMTCPDCGMCETHVDHTNLDEACWKGYHKEGNKKMFGKTYPNCVKNEGVTEENKNHHFIYEGIWDNIKNIFKAKPKYVRPTQKIGELDSEFQQRVTDAWNKYQAELGNPTEEPARFGSNEMGHGSEDNELRMFMAGQKPAAIISLDQLPKWKKLIDSRKYATAQLTQHGRPSSVIIAQPGEEHRIEKLQRLVQNAIDAGEKGDFRAYQNSNYHRWVGKLLGYSADKINSFIQHYFKDTPDLAKKPVYEEQHSESCPHCGGELVSEELMHEKQDACYRKVKSRYKVWPSAYASGALVQCRKKGASNWGNGGKKNESSILEGINRADESLHDWFNKEKWVRMDTKGKIKGPCAREPGEGKPKCLPQSKAHSLGKKGRASAAQRKRREDPNPDRSGKAINVDTKKNKG